ncbi:MAG: NTP transferase domain-containing protein [Pseudomonadota bacterium]
MIDTAVLLAAGEGSRLRAVAPSKPLCPVAGKPLIAHAIEGMAAAGIAQVIVVLGYEKEAVRAYLASRDWPVAVETVETRDHREPNGVSVLAAEAALAGGEALLAMCDHIVEPALYARVAATGAQGGATLGVDRDLLSDWVDLDDVTCVATEGDRIVAIGKGLAEYDCFDVGVFAIGPGLFAALSALPSPSLSAGMTALAATGAARVVDCSGLQWLDVDDAPALAKAEGWLGMEIIPKPAM